MHWFGAAVVPPGIPRSDIEPYVDKVMATSREDDVCNGVWDWWQVGGRWTGVWGEYDASKDPRNVETCRVCGGTGRREDAARFGEAWMEQMRGCNGCLGEGTAQKWPTQWAEYDGDIVTVRAFLNNPTALRRPLTVFLPDGSYISRESYDPNSGFSQITEDEWHALVNDTLAAHADQALVVVDYHS